MKKFTAILMAIVLISAMCIPVCASGALSVVVDTSGSSISYNYGDTVNVVLSLTDIDFGDGDGVSCLEFVLNYDASKVAPQVKASADSDGDEGDFASLLTKSPSGWEAFGVLDEDAGQYSLIFSDISGSGTVADDNALIITLPFLVNSESEMDDLVFSLEDVKAHNSDMDAYCRIYLSDVVIPHAPQNGSAVELPDDAIVLDYAGYVHDVNNVIFYAQSDMLVRDYVWTYIDAAANQDKLSNFGVAVVDSQGVITYCDTSIGTDKSEVSIPAGSYIIAIHKNSTGYASFAANAAVQKTIALYNVIVEAADICPATALTKAGFVIGDYEDYVFELALKEGVDAKFSDDGATLILFQAGLTVSEFKNLFVDSAFELLDADGAVYESGVVGTGNVINVDSGVEVVLLGDVNCDGALNVTDYLMLKKVVLGSYQASGASFEACCIAGGTEPKAVDYLILRRTILGEVSLSQVYAQFWA